MDFTFKTNLGATTRSQDDSELDINYLPQKPTFKP